MAIGILGQKIGMTQLFVDDRALGATVIQAHPCTVVQIKTKDKHGYSALQLGSEQVNEGTITRPLSGHYASAQSSPHRRLFEVKMDDVSEYSVGDKIGVEVFSEGDEVDVSGMSRGLGFQGVVKRWNFAGGPKSHGSHFHRRPGSVGNCVKPGRVIKGRKLPGHTGNRRITVKKIKVLRCDPDKNLLVLRGSTPGPRGCVLKVSKKNGRS